MADNDHEDPIRDGFYVGMLIMAVIAFGIFVYLNGWPF